VLLACPASREVLHCPAVTRPDPIFTPRLALGVALVAVGLGLLFLSAKVVTVPRPTGIAAGIVCAVAGLVVVMVEALRDPPDQSR
jgi:hypothetical protein